MEKVGIKNYLVDTYYGYVYDDELHQWVPASDSEESKPLYQVPIIRSGDNSKGLLEYGKYKVTITLTYSESIDQTPDKGGYDFYFDGVRIYGSANKTNNDYNVIDDAYNLDKENNPEYLEIRKMLLSRQDNDNLDLPQPGVGFIDGKDEGATLNDYEDYGPKNETYLKKGQAISFYLESKYLPDSVQFGAKIAQGNNIDLKISCANKENDEWKYYKGKTLTINSATELYRDLSDQCIWDKYEVDGEIKYRTRYPIVITNTSEIENIISLTNVKLTGGPDTDDTVAVNFFAYTDFNAVEAAYSLARSQFEKKITVKYVDQNGQMLADDVITKVDVNNEYDVTDLVNKEIAGYTRLEVKGDTTGVIDSDKEITVVYGKNYQLAVKYVDLQGNEIEETYVNSGVEGNEYDVTDLVNKEIAGYTR
uniref:MucBP domain-containing protein n=1 Tax=Thomasclavelia spiroformis TaxID=29348 RepID=UPI00242BE0B1